MKKIITLSVLLFVFYFFSEGFAQQSSSLDAARIADIHYNSIVKIILYDSIAEKKQPNSGYIGRGSGFFVTDDGIIFTNRHTVEYCVFGYMDYTYNDASTFEQFRGLSVYSDDKVHAPTTFKVHRIGHTAPIIQVYTGKGENEYKLYYAKVIAMDVGAFDGAILKIVSDLRGNPVTEKFHSVPIGNSDSTRQGEDLCIYGFPAQFDAGLALTLQDMSTLTFGKHSGFDFVYSKDFGYIKTDASINSGNSGGPVFNQDNKVVGIATAAFNKTNIGLVGGINAMYFIVSPEVEVLQKLSSKGLKIPKSAGSIKTVSGKHQSVMTQKQMEEINKKKQADYEARKAEADFKKQTEAMGAYSASLMMNKPKTKKIFYGGIGGGTYQRGTLDLFWQTINNDASLKATGTGSPFVWNTGFQIFFSASKESKGYFGFGLEYFATSKKAIGASNMRDNVLNEIKTGLQEILITLPIAYQVRDKLSIVFEPGLIYFGIIRGSITAYGNTYQEKNTIIGTGWNIVAGPNYSLKKYFGISLRAGYRHLNTQEIHRDGRSGSELSYSFFANGIDGDNTVIKWSGFYFTTGIYFSFDSKDAGKKKKGTRK